MWTAGASCAPSQATRCCLCVALSGGRAACGLRFWDKTLKVWDVESGRELRTLKGHTDSSLRVALTPRTGGCVSASSDRR